MNYATGNTSKVLVNFLHKKIYILRVKNIITEFLKRSISGPQNLKVGAGSGPQDLIPEPHLVTTH